MLGYHIRGHTPPNNLWIHFFATPMEVFTHLVDVVVTLPEYQAFLKQPDRDETTKTAETTVWEEKRDPTPLWEKIEYLHNPQSLREKIVSKPNSLQVHIEEMDLTFSPKKRPNQKQRRQCLL